MHRAGYVLTGGRSSRMGRDKALLPFRGRTLVECVAQTVRQAAGSATLVGPKDLYGSLDLPLIEDPRRGQGPLSGIHAALSHSTAEWSLITACDLPNLTPEFLSFILEHAEKQDVDVVMPYGVVDRPEPMCAVYRRTCLAAAGEALAQGRLKVTDAWKGLRVNLVPVAEMSCLVNVNTPQEWENALHRFEVSLD